MIKSALDEHLNNPGAKRDCEAVTLHEGGVHLTLRSRSRLLAARVPAHSSIPKSRPISPFTPSLTLCKPLNPTLQRFPTRGVTKSPAAQLPAWRTTKKVNVSHLAFHEPSLLKLRDLERPVTQELARQCWNLPAPSQEEPSHIPCIVISAPDQCPTSLNTVPSPQDAGYGTLLTVPDPNFSITNRPDPSWSRFHLQDSSFCSSSVDEVNVIIKEDSDRIPALPLPKEDEDVDDVSDLGHTWSG